MAKNFFAILYFNYFWIFDIMIVSRAFDSMRIEHDNITLRLGYDNLIQKVK